MKEMDLDFLMRKYILFLLVQNIHNLCFNAIYGKISPKLSLLLLTWSTDSHKRNYLQTKTTTPYYLKLCKMSLPHNITKLKKKAILSMLGKLKPRYTEVI